MDWDYTELASYFDKRPGYCEDVIDRAMAKAGMKAGFMACDVGAGTGRLTLLLARRGFRVIALEPNPTMLLRGIVKTQSESTVAWTRSIGEATGLVDSAFDLVAFGSSFNVVHRDLALLESARMLKPGGWFRCVWNHRDLKDPLQKKIEEYIEARIPGYQYGQRRADQRQIIAKPRLFGEVHYFESRFVCRISHHDCLEAWRSHATLHRQAGGEFESVLEGIGRILVSTDQQLLGIPYNTRLWMAAAR